MTDSELHEIENHISWGWHDDKGNDDVRLLFNEIMRLRTVAAEAREEGRIEGIDELERGAVRLKIDNSTGVAEPFVLLSDIQIIAERLKEQGK